MNGYFAGKLKEFSLPYHLEATSFLKKTWREILKIDYGKTLSYQELAKKVATDHYSRAVAMACHKNPLVILIPCHRIIASDKTMRGYAYGVETKKKILYHEKNHP